MRSELDQFAKSLLITMFACAGYHFQDLFPRSPKYSMEKRRNREDGRGSPCNEGIEWPLFIENKTGGVEGDNEGQQEEGNQCNLPWRQQGVIYCKGMHGHGEIWRLYEQHGLGVDLHRRHEQLICFVFTGTRYSVLTT